MITAYGVTEGRIEPIGGSEAIAEGSAERIVWIDLIEPTAEEDALIERLLGIDIPNREDMEEIEVSSRLYSENGAVFMTVLLPANTETERHAIKPVAFILNGTRLVTVRYHQPRAFDTFAARAQKVDLGCMSGLTVLTALLDAVIDRIADILERAAQDVEAISREVFAEKTTKLRRSKDFHAILRGIGRKADLVSGIRDSLATLQRMLGFLGHVTARDKTDKEARAVTKTLVRDTTSLIDHAQFLSQKITFLLDATLGMISIEQNGIIKIFSVAAVIFLPPTLVASIYGMNFEHMPELQWLWGYPYAIGLMIVSAIVPYLFFKNRGWL
jgi:magnesium transporter